MRPDAGRRRAFHVLLAVASLLVALTSAAVQEICRTLKPKRFKLDQYGR